MALELNGMKWPDKIQNLPASGLLPKYKILFKILIHNLDSLTHHSDLSHETVVMLFIFGTKVGLDLIKLMFEKKNMQEGPQRVKQYKLPYPSLIHYYSANLGIPALPRLM